MESRTLDPGSELLSMHTYRKILLPLDFSARNARAVKAVVELARAHGSDVILLHVIQLVELVSDDLDDFYAKMEGWAREKMGKYASQLKDREISFQEEIVYGSRLTEIVSATERFAADLLVLSSPPADDGDITKRLATINDKLALLAPCHILLVK